MKPINILCLLFLLMGLCSAEDITLNTPSDGDGCVLGESSINFSYTPNVAVTSCFLYANDTGTLAQKAVNSSAVAASENFFLNIPLNAGPVAWYVRCVNSSADDLYSSNFTFTLKNVAYCAVLSSTSCPKDPNINSMAVVKTRLGNTRGFWLQNQDCNVFMTDSQGRIVRAYDSMLYMQQVSLQLDTEGNWVNVADKKVPLTDSGGYYVFPFLVERDNFWMGDEYTANIVCNGETTTCKFNVTSDRLPDMNNYQRLGQESAGIVILFVILAYLVFRYFGTLKKEVFGHK
jgi:hypothetical protein